MSSTFCCKNLLTGHRALGKSTAEHKDLVALAGSISPKGPPLIVALLALLHWLPATSHSCLFAVLRSLNKVLLHHSLRCLLFLASHKALPPSPVHKARAQEGFRMCPNGLQDLSQKVCPEQQHQKHKAAQGDFQSMTTNPAIAQTKACTC